MDSLNKCKWQDRNDQAVDIRICEYGRVDDGVGEGFGRADPAEESIGIIMSTHSGFKKLSFESYDCLQEDCNWERSSVPHSTFIEDEVIGHQDFWRRKDDLLGEIFEIGNSLSC